MHPLLLPQALIVWHPLQLPVFLRASILTPSAPARPSLLSRSVCLTVTVTQPS
eukprot:COSAG06_NODE_34279_length_477_cov_0.677249_1_plen_52_part_10